MRDDENQHGSGDNSTGEALNSYTFGLQARDRLAEEYPGIDTKSNTLLLFLNRTSAGFTEELELKVHKPLGLTWSGYRLLFVLWIAGDLEPARVAELTFTSRASVSSLSTTFINKGFVGRRPSKTDGRSVLLSLTEEGERLVREAFEAQDRVQHELMSVLTDAEQEILQVLLSKMMIAGISQK